MRSKKFDERLTDVAAGHRCPLSGGRRRAAQRHVDVDDEQAVARIGGHVEALRAARTDRAARPPA